MGKRLAAVDAYIARSRPFAQPILVHLRDVVHAAGPDVDEVIKWGMPFFEYKGQLCYMAAFKAHAGFGFYNHGLLVKDSRLPARLERSAMGSLGRITSLDELPPRRTLMALVKLAIRLKDEGVKRPPRPRPRPRPAIRPPADFLAALAKNRKALVTYQGFPPGRRRDYLEWITGAKTSATRDRRIATAVAWLAEGKAHNWRYEKKRG